MNSLTRQRGTPRAFARAMRNHKSLKFKPKALFAHADDAAFDVLAKLEGLFARMVSRKGSRFLRERMQRASARLADIIIVATDEDTADRISASYEPAVQLCKLVDGFLRLLSNYGVLTAEEHDSALRFTRELMQIVARRYFGFDVVNDDGGPSSPGSSVPPAASVMIPGGTGRFEIAADAPTLVAGS